MIRYAVRYAERAIEQLEEIGVYVAECSSEQIADRFIDGIVDACETLSMFPKRGVRRDDLRPGLRILGYRRRVSVAFEVEGDRVNILGVYYGGQNYDAEFMADGE